MEINITDFTQSEIYRPCTVLAAMHEILTGMSKGQKIKIDSMRGAFGEIVQVQYIRTSISKINKDIGIKVATRATNNDYPVYIFRVY